MYSSMIGKIAKGRRYAYERNRLSIELLTASFRGENGAHAVSYNPRQWGCDCNFFKGHRTCGHTMATQQMLAEMLPQQISTSLS